MQGCHDSNSAIWTHKDDSRMVNIVFISLNCNVCNYTYLKWVHTNTEEHSTPCVELFICQDSLGMEVELTRCHGTCLNHHSRLIVSL
ncbi:hypothetical protein R3W88_002369 [Solanum pinnatisectum]|uniref:Uncharacterized protein n=1 Tax=Solanum pinnatisectum TaxID=50273 RepID=A0AAV9MPR5_9SOLN|nr:hypothetical protein R3W88_002369 [Solanum pinnatisectum]